MKKVHLIIGTRPEAIKMAPVYIALKKRQGLAVKLVSTGQHRELLGQALAPFGLRPDHDLGVMRAGQTLSELTAALLLKLEVLFRSDRPDVVLGHGDTTSCYVTALSAFYHSIPFLHVEAGLRSHDLMSPFPEEFNRRTVAGIASHHFTPTEIELEQLKMEGILKDAITVCGSTVQESIEFFRGRRGRLLTPLDGIDGRKIALMTLHRREKGSRSLESSLAALGRSAREFSDIVFVFPVHPNPKLREAAQRVFQGIENVVLTDSLEYPAFLSLISRSQVIITDSGGIQEEAAYLGKKVLLLREETERSDGLALGTTRLIGTNPEGIRLEVSKALMEVESGVIQDAVPAGLLVRPSEVIADFVAGGCLA